VLLRAVNLAGHNRLTMADLVRIATDAGFQDARTVLQSGNLVGRAPRASDEALERRLEAAIAKALGVETEIFVRTAEEWRAIIGANPFPKAAREDPAHLLMMALKHEPTATQVGALRAAIKGRETVEAIGRQAYLIYPDGVGQSKLTAAVIERHLGTRGTARNWNSVLRLAALAETA